MGFQRKMLISLKHVSFSRYRGTVPPLVVENLKRRIIKIDDIDMEAMYSNYTEIPRVNGTARIL